MKSCSLKILELFYNAKHTGRIVKPEAIGRVGEDNDGLVIELTWRVVNGIIEDAKFRAFGNPNAIAITSLMTSNIIGKSVEEAVMIDESVIKEGLDEIRPEYIEAFDMVKSAIVEAYNNYLKRNKRIVSEVITSVEEKEFDDESIVDEDLIEESLTVQQIETVLVTEKRGRGRPRKIVDESQVIEIIEKRGRGRPRKIVPEGEMVESAEKRGRGRPRKVVDESQVIELTEKRGRGRPRKIVDESQIVEPAEKRGRGRPRKERVEPEIVGEKRGRGRPRKIVSEGEIVEPAEKRGRGRPRKIVDESQVFEPAEKRGRGRPRKLTIETLEPIKHDFYAEENQNKITLPNDLDEVINDEEVDELINGKHQVQETDTFVDNLIANKPVEEDDDMFDSDYDIFKSNIRSILSGNEKSKQEYTHSHTSHLTVDNKSIEQAKAVETNNEISQDEKSLTEIDTTIADAGEKRGRGRPRKVVDESQVVEPAEKRSRGRPRLNTVNSLTRSLTANGGSRYSNHEIVFASKNVTTTNININVTKTTTNVEDEKSYTDDYEKSINILSVQENSNISTPLSMVEQDDEIEIEPVSAVEYNQDTTKQFNELSDDELDELEEDYEEEVFDEDIKDEAPKGIEDLLKALLQDD